LSFFEKRLPLLDSGINAELVGVADVSTPRLVIKAALMAYEAK